MSECKDDTEREGIKGEGLLGRLFAVGLDGEESVSSTVLSTQIIASRFSTVVSAPPQDNADMCLLSSSIRSEWMMVATTEACADTEREINIVLRVNYHLLVTYKLCVLSTIPFHVFGFGEHPTRTAIACYGQGYQ